MRFILSLLLFNSVMCILFLLLISFLFFFIIVFLWYWISYQWIPFFFFLISFGNIFSGFCKTTKKINIIFLCVCVVSRFKCMTTHANYLAFAICETRLLLLFHLDAKIQLNFLLDISLYFMFFDILNLWILIRNLFLNLVTFSNTKKYSVIEITFNKVWLNNHMKFEIFQFDCTRNTPTLIYTNKQNKY